MKIALATLAVAATLTPGIANAAPVSCSTSNASASIKRCVTAAQPGLDAAYQRMATAAGQTWRAPSVVPFGKRPPSDACESLEGGVASSFYCTDTNTVYLMLSISKDSTQRYAQRARADLLRADARAAGVPVSQLRKGLGGPAQVNVLAHEMAHSLLTSSGVWKWYSDRSDRYEPGSAKYDRFGFVHETIADCLSGVAQRSAQDAGALRMNAADLWAARADYAGADPFDDATPKASPFVYQNPWGARVYRGYGGPYIRLKAFNEGWSMTSTNPLRTCVQFAAGLKKVPVAPQVR